MTFSAHAWQRSTTYYFLSLMQEMRTAIERASHEPRSFERWKAGFHADRASGVD